MTGENPSHQAIHPREQYVYIVSPLRRQTTSETLHCLSTSKTPLPTSATYYPTDDLTSYAGWNDAISSAGAAEGSPCVLYSGEELDASYPGYADLRQQGWNDIASSWICY
ncbi:hypothetical protein M8818_004363 [Zalaria obscura]|uniref:Uncharacterized protein n=1 Tax=Zalaria obscura TaxID=2024903 RepID=A0ACC3SAX0_9PEZI